MRFWFSVLLLLVPLALQAQDLPTIETKTAGFEARPGFLPVYWDAGAGKVWLEIPRLDEDLLYFTSLPSGLGSNDIGLDRGLLGTERIVRFERVGPKVLMVAPNLDYRASSDNPAEVRAVRDAFAEGILWGFTVAAQTGERVLVDATAFAVRDAQEITRRLQQTGQGTFRLDGSRSVPHPAMTKAFPENTEVEVRLTFTSDRPGRFVRDVAAEPQAFALRLRHSFVQLPDDGYTPRAHDPRAGYYGITYADYATPIDADKVQRYIARHRLSCAGPIGADSLCTASEPIVYYLDPGTPEPVRSALLDGARWWDQAFRAAGYRDAFRVEMLPDDADPMDVRYNMIQWVHRATRGWSYGRSIRDPRTGEIIKGHVSLGSLRVRQDYLLFEGLLAPYAGDQATGMPDPATDPMLQAALARLRQLSAHEIGHTLGIMHNFAASVNNRASVMDYPAPFVTLDDSGRVDLSQAYDTDIGEWDIATIRYGYTDFPEGADEQAELDAILAEAEANGLLYITDADARPVGGAHPLAHLWDNGTNPVEALTTDMQVRRVALDRFGVSVIPEGDPLTLLEEALVPLYLRHRYQVEAVSKLVGGVSYNYALRGGTQPVPERVSGDLQRQAVEALLETIEPDALALPANLRATIPPRAPGYPANRELFDGRTGLIFDPYAPAEVVSSLVLSLLMHHERAARMVYQADMDASLPSLSDLMTQVSGVVWERSVPRDAHLAELQRLTQTVWTDVLLSTAANEEAAPAVRTRATEHLRALQIWIQENPGGRRDLETVAHRNYTFDQIDRYLLRLHSPEDRQASVMVPPGSPIGQEAPAFLTRQRHRHAWLDAWTDHTRVCAMD
ncbi:MAG: zinc-dependent metalloprotease [Bacteroidota bacterium]